jgi:hypothetical protein
MTVRDRRAWRASVFIVVVILAAASSAPADAHWLSKLARGAAEVGEVGAGAKGGKLGLGALESAATHIRKLPEGSKAAALAAEATPEGHWRFVNREGEVFTAGTPDEMRRAIPTLLPGAAASGEARVALYLSEDTVFGSRGFLKELPPGAELHVVVGRSSYKLIQRGDRLLCEVKPNVVLDVARRDDFNAALWQLSRPLNKSNIRTLALEPGGVKRLSSVPRFDPQSKVALVDKADPAALPGALASVKGQTVLITGHVEGDLLHFQPSSGAAGSVAVSDLAEAARLSDVNLVVLRSSSMKQPGGRNWLWQKISVKGLDDALRRATFGDFLDALGARRGQFTVSAQPDGWERVTLTAAPDGPPGEPMTGTIGDWLDNATANITGHVVTNAVQIFARDEHRQQELDARFIPGIPAIIQYGYLISLAAGLLGYSFSLAWWARIWPPEAREEYSSGFGYHAARLARLLALVLIFLPLAGLPAFICSGAVHTWETIMTPFRLLGRLLRWMRPQAG